MFPHYVIAFKVIIQFDFLKKIVLKSPEYWYPTNRSGGLSAHSNIAGSTSVSEIVSTVFTFKDFFKAFKIISKIGYRNVDDSP